MARNVTMTASHVMASRRTSGHGDNALQQIQTTSTCYSTIYSTLLMSCCSTLLSWLEQVQSSHQAQELMRFSSRRSLLQRLGKPQTVREV